MIDTAKLVQEIRDRITVNRWVTIQQVVASPPIRALIEKANRAEEWKRLAEDLTDPDECWFDHHGYCQAHGLYEPPCPHGEVKALLTKEQNESEWAEKMIAHATGEKQNGPSQAEVTEHLIGTTQYLIDYMDQSGLLEEGCFTFPDGETWWATGREQNE